MSGLYEESSWVVRQEFFLVLKSMATNYELFGELVMAEQSAKLTADGFEKIYGRDHPETIGMLEFMSHIEEKKNRGSLSV